MNYDKELKNLLQHPEKLKTKKPFSRGHERSMSTFVSDVNITSLLEAVLPKVRVRPVSQEQFMRELDPSCHDILFDESIPSIGMKTVDGGYYEIKYERMPVPIQKMIKKAKAMRLTANKMQFTLMEKEPTEQQSRDYATIKNYWLKRNQDGMKTKMVDAQLSYGDAGLLYYFDRNGKIKSRILSYKDGYVLCPHNDSNGDRLLEAVYYCIDEVEYIDCYDDTYMYRYVNDLSDESSEKKEEGVYRIGTWRMTKTPHGFSECPLITKRGDVAWNDVQNIITAYEVLYNVFNATQKRLGWGMLYIKGKLKQTGEKINGSVILNDNSLDANGDAKFLEPPSPKGILETLNLLLEAIQMGSGCTFILPKDVKTSGEISGVAVQLTQSIDMQSALESVIEWQNVADKMLRLFKEGLAKELVNSGEQPTAVTDFENLNIHAEFKPWRPFSESEYNAMVTNLVGAGVLSIETGVEVNTVSKPDELIRLKREEESMAIQQQQQQQAETQIGFSFNQNNQ